MPAEVQRNILPRINTLLTNARASGTEVIYIQHDGAQGHALGTHTTNWKFTLGSNQMRASRSPGSESRTPVFETTLEQELKKGGITSLVMAGRDEYCGHYLPTVRPVWGTALHWRSDARLSRDNAVCSVLKS